jgi:hypothetical protein
MEIRTLAEVLGEVRQNDINEFRVKIEAMEAERKMELATQGFDTFDSLMEKRGAEKPFEDKLDSEPNREVIQVDPTESKDSEEVFSRFIQSIRG